MRPRAENGLEYLKGAMDNLMNPMAATLGGAKMSTNIPGAEAVLDTFSDLGSWKAFEDCHTCS